MRTSTTFDIPRSRIVETKGLVRGIVVRAPTIFQGLLGGLKSMVGGKIGAYTEMCEQTRQQAFEAMEAHAREMGANAIVGIRYDASSVEDRSAAVEVLCYGTAVVVKEQAS